MKSTIYLIRHGITEGNLKRWHYGWADIPLAPEGISTLEQYREEGIYPEIEDGFMYTSGMLRTEMTFRIIFGEREHKVAEKLKEMNFGIFEKKTYEELKDDPEYIKWISDREGFLAIPEGESRRGFYERVIEGFEEIVNLHRLRELAHRHDGGHAVSAVVCHGGVIGCIMMQNFGKDWNEFSGWIPDPGRGYALTIEDGKCISYEKI